MPGFAIAGMQKLPYALGVRSAKEESGMGSAGSADSALSFATLCLLNSPFSEIAFARC